MLKKVSIYIDGANFYHALKKSNININGFQILQFCTSLFPAEKYQLTKINYYIGKVPFNSKTSRLKSMYAAQQRQIALLKSQQVNIIFGKLKYMNGNFIEKGVDVKLALDYALDAFTKKFDLGILISSDGDLYPAVNALKQTNSHSLSILFRNHYSSLLSQAADQVKVFSANQLRKFIN